MSIKVELSSLVSGDGQLDNRRIAHKVAIYEARNGKHVERFSYEGVSYIFKPCSAMAASREQWAQQYLIPSIQGVKVPLLLASGGMQQSTDHWIIYEDLGSLNHCNDPDDIIRAAGHIPSWHRIPTLRMPMGAVGHSPSFTQVLEAITMHKPYVNELVEACGIDKSMISGWWALLPDWEPFIQEHQAVSHGDYYRLNIALQSRETIVLDWEFAHVNSIYWDLYSLMDITSHRYSRIDLQPSDRESTLHEYWSSKENLIPVEHYSRFMKGYSVFASVYAAWILTLIKADFQRGNVDNEALRRQQQETELVFQQCLQTISLW